MVLMLWRGRLLRERGAGRSQGRDEDEGGREDGAAHAMVRFLPPYHARTVPVSERPALTRMFKRMDCQPVTRREIACAIRKSPGLFGAATVLALAAAACGGSTPSQPGTPPPAAPTGPPKPLEGATITITSAGFALDAASSAFPLADLHVYQGGRLTFVSMDNTTHDVLSDPPHVHTDCPEINAAGFLVPGQSRSTDPLNRLMTCGFHDHTHEGESAFAGKVTVEAR